MICTSLQNKTFEQILAILEDPAVEMAEIRLDRCPLTDEEIESLFSDSDTPLIATCRLSECDTPQEAERRLALAIESGARFADLEIEAPAPVSKHFQHLCRKHGTEVIRSYHNFEQTPDLEVLQMALARCFRYGADIAKIVTACQGPEDAARLESLYSIVLEGVDSLQGRLVAFGMGEAGRDTRLECLRRGAPFTYAALSPEEATAPGQWSVAEMNDALYGGRKPYRVEGR
ncbi:MAG: type I 3-dehydroquinate dehydratase, partial [Bacteroidales bacterium]|nr:type I 3-dehydroquinate dehydratase [Bacteroidales bacterium]